MKPMTERQERLLSSLHFFAGDYVTTPFCGYSNIGLAHKATVAALMRRGLLEVAILHRPSEAGRLVARKLRHEKGEVL